MTSKPVATGEAGVALAKHAQGRRDKAPDIRKQAAPPAGETVRLHLLGPARLQIGRGAARPLERHDALLLALLAIEGPMNRAHLARLLWPSSASRDATGSLRQRLHRLALVAGGPVVQGHAQVQLVAHVRHDMTVQHACSPTAADGLCRDLLEALECEREPELADWLALARRRWREWSAQRLAQVAQALEDAGDLEGALQWAERLRARAPAQESSHRRVMRLHHLLGDGAAALAAYRLCVAQLEQDLGLAPGDEIEAMRQIAEAGMRQPAVPVPAQLGSVFERRLLDLSPAALRLAQLAALAGDAFSVPLAAAVLQKHAIELAAPWRELEEAQILRGGAFLHDMFRDAALRTVPAVIAIELHRQIAGHAGPLGLPLATQAWHLVRAARPAEAALVFAQAAREAGQRGDWTSALNWWDRSAANHLTAEDADAAWAAERAAAAIALEIAGDEDATRRLQGLLDRSKAGVQRGQALILKARSAVAHARFNEAEQAARDALGCTGPLNAAQTVEAAALHGLSLATLKRHEEALVLFARHADAARTLAEPWPRSEFLSAQGHAHAQADQLREAIAAWEAAASGALQAGRVGDAVVNLINASGTASFLGQLQHALQLAEQAQALRETLASGHALAEASATMQRGTLHIALGRYGEAHVSLLQALQQWTGAGVKTWRVVAENSLAYLYWLLGQHARARQALATPLVLGEPGFARRQVIKARLKLQPPDASRAHLRAALERPAPTDRGITRFGTQLALAALAAPSQRAAEFAALLHEAREREHLSVALHACIRHADALRDVGEPAAGAAAARDAIAMADAGCIPHDLYLGEFWWLAHQSLQAAGDTCGARGALLRGEAWVRQAALPNVEEPFRDSFLHRNEVNARLLSAALRAR